MTKAAAYKIRAKRQRLFSAVVFGMLAAVCVFSATMASAIPGFAELPVWLFGISIFLFVWRFRVALRRLPAWLIAAVVITQLFFLRLLSAPVTPNQHGQIVLRAAIATGNVAAVRMLVDHGGDVRSLSGDALGGAARNSDLSMLHLLIENGARVSEADDSSRALWDSVDSGQVDAAEILLEAGANPNSLRPSDSASPAGTVLSLAESRNSRQIVLLLRRAGATE